MKTSTFVQKATVFLVLFCVFAGMTTLQAQTYPEQPTSGPGIDPNAKLLLDFEDPAQRTGWTFNYMNAVAAPSVEVMDAENGDPVRFGRYAMKVVWDFSGGGAGTLAQLCSPPGPSFKIEPELVTANMKFGMWIYCSPECAGNLWLRLNLHTPANGAAGTGAVGVWDNEPGTANALWLQPGTWKYYEFYIPNTAPKNVELGPSANTSPSYGMFRIIHITGTAATPNAKGYFIVDNIRVINSTNVEDRTPPTISALTGNATDLATTGTTFDTAGIDFSMTYTDGTAATASGINVASAKFIVNGVPYSSGSTGFTADDATATLTGVRLPTGTNTIVAHIEDMFGFITTKSSTFTIDDGGTAITLDPDAQAEVGNVFEIKVNTNDRQDVKALEVEMDLNSIASVAASGGIEFTASASASTYNFNAATGRLTIHLANNVATAEEGEGTLATIKVDIPKNCLYTDVLRITPVSANVTYADDSSTPFALFSSNIDRPVKETYDFTVLKRVVGITGEVLVTDLSDDPVPGATVYALKTSDSSPIANGVTDADGVASFDFTATAQNVDIYAEKDGKYSYTRTLYTLSPVLTNTPSGIRSGTTADPTTSKTIVWLSNPVTSEHAAYIKIARKSNGEDAFAQHEGEARTLEYAADASRNAAQGSKVTVTGLKPGTEYIYQVGDGTSWSATREFATTTVTDKFTFNAFGDVQAANNGDMSMFVTAAQNVLEQETTPFFSLNVGDVPDRDNRWDYLGTWNYLFDQKPDFGEIDMVATYGNHEYDGYAGNMLFLNGHPAPEPKASANMDIVGEGTYYAVYGNMLAIGLDWEAKDSFIAGSTYTTAQRIAEQAKWMDEVLEAHKDKTWKIVTLHYPIFPDQSSPGLQSVYGSLFDKHNVQIVFCGHGHTFERYQAKGGVTTTTSGERKTLKPDIEKGTLYWQIGGMAPNTGTDQRRWIFAEVDGGKIDFTVFNANTNAISESECFTMYAGPQDPHEVNFEVVNGNGTLIATAGGDEIETGDEVTQGRNVVFAATPEEGYCVREWTLNGEIIAGNKTNTYILENLRAEATVTVEFEPGTGIKPAFAPELKIYPNPFADVLTIAGAENGTLRIMDVVGKMVHAQKISANETIGLEQLSPGVYLFRVETNGQAKTVKVVKK